MEQAVQLLYQLTLITNFISSLNPKYWCHAFVRFKDVYHILSLPRGLPKELYSIYNGKIIKLKITKSLKCSRKPNDEAAAEKKEPPKEKDKKPT